MKPGGSLRKSIGLSCQSPEPVEGGAKSEEDGEGEIESTLIPGGLVPTAEERVDWAETVQSFPTEGRPQARMVSSQMGTTSYAEAVPSSGAGRRGASRRRTGSRWERKRQEQAVEESRSRQGGILVVTEMRREIVQDPGFAWVCEVGSDGEAEVAGKAEAEAEAEAAGRRGGQAATVPSLDELPLPDVGGTLNSHNA